MSMAAVACIVPTHQRVPVAAFLRVLRTPSASEGRVHAIHVLPSPHAVRARATTRWNTCTGRGIAVEGRSRAMTTAATTGRAADVSGESMQEGDKEDDIPHVPVLLEEILGFWRDRPTQVYVDGTLGAGGHATAMVGEHPELRTLVGLDVDPLAHELAGARIRSTAPSTLSVHLIRSNFRHVGEVLAAMTPPLADCGVDAMLLDFGVSSMQIDSADRGFSFLADGPVDMRMDPQAALRAEEVVNDWPEEKLGQIICDYGEERNWRGIAARIIAARPIHTTAQLVKAIGGPRGGGGGKGGKKGKGIHPATRTFQAIRIAVNDELTVIQEVLPAAIRCLKPGGRLGVISFHSLEDRIVKQAFRAAAGMKPSSADEVKHPSLKWVMQEEPEREKLVRILTRKPVVATEAEQRDNPRSRSAKLRFVEKL